MGLGFYGKIVGLSNSQRIIRLIYILGIFARLGVNGRGEPQPFSISGPPSRCLSLGSTVGCARPHSPKVVHRITPFQVHGGLKKIPLLNFECVYKRNCGVENLSFS